MFYKILIIAVVAFSGSDKIGGWAFDIHSRIVGGESANITDYPYQISLSFLGIHICGGSIIHPQYVLSAAHCIHESFAPTHLAIRAGSSYVNHGGTIVSVAEIKCHQNYNSSTEDYDLCLLKLKEPLKYSSEIFGIKLPQQDEDVPGNLDAVATGWGRLEENGSLPVRLQKVVIPTLDFTICQLVYGDQITARMMCAGLEVGGKDTCKGDSGGPLVYNNTLIGITSWGDGCGEPNSPGIYTKVSYFTNYITAEINSGT